MEEETYSDIKHTKETEIMHIDLNEYWKGYRNGFLFHWSPHTPKVTYDDLKEMEKLVSHLEIFSCKGLETLGKRIEDGSFYKEIKEKNGLLVERTQIVENLNSLGVFYASTGKFKIAEKLYKILDFLISPPSFIIKHNLGIVFMMECKYEEAREKFAEANLILVENPHVVDKSAIFLMKGFWNWASALCYIKDLQMGILTPTSSYLLKACENFEKSNNPEYKNYTGGRMGFLLANYWLVIDGILTGDIGKFIASALHQEMLPCSFYELLTYGFFDAYKMRECPQLPVLYSFFISYRNIISFLSHFMNEKKILCPLNKEIEILHEHNFHKWAAVVEWFEDLKKELSKKKIDNLSEEERLLIASLLFKERSKRLSLTIHEIFIDEEKVSKEYEITIKDFDEVLELEKNDGSPIIKEGIVYKSKKIKKLLEEAERIADTNSTILIMGESGVGKDLLANAIHRMSKRKDGPFVDINVGQLHHDIAGSELFGSCKGTYAGTDEREGVFEQAKGGTLFLNEIGEAEKRVQVHLLKAIEKKEINRIGCRKHSPNDGYKQGNADHTKIKVDVRIIAATNRNLEDAVKNGEFREDLYNRIKTFTLFIPPLREHKGDIPFLIDFFLDKYSRESGKTKKQFTSEAKNLFLAYDWPSNIRELSGSIENLTISLVNEETITEEHIKAILPQIIHNVNSISGSSERRNRIRKEELIKVIEKYEKDEDICKELNISRATLYRLLSKFGLGKRSLKKRKEQAVS